MVSSLFRCVELFEVRRLRFDQDFPLRGVSIRLLLATKDLHQENQNAGQLLREVLGLRCLQNTRPRNQLLNRLLQLRHLCDGPSPSSLHFKCDPSSGHRLLRNLFERGRLSEMHAGLLLVRQSLFGKQNQNSGLPVLCSRRNLPGMHSFLLLVPEQMLLRLRQTMRRTTHEHEMPLLSERVPDPEFRWKLLQKQRREVLRQIQFSDRVLLVRRKLLQLQGPVPSSGEQSNSQLPTANRGQHLHLVRGWLLSQPGPKVLLQEPDL